MSFRVLAVSREASAHLQQRSDLRAQPNRSWRWRDSNGGGSVPGNPVQRHIYDITCEERGTQWYPLAPVGTRWHAQSLRALCPIRVLLPSTP